MSNWITKACVGISIALLVACGGKETRLEEHYNKGVGYYTSGDYEKARVEFKNVLQIEPKHIASLGYMGQTLEALEDPRGAFAHYQRAVELNPDALDIKTRLVLLAVGPIWRWIWPTKC
ncbi:MAG: hypothetical protein FD130_461 [Halothiobacillaceae bacterium]|nr:MAG: hypothetical protein FD130_461 [Halothiobacillaceae bacterium]